MTSENLITFTLKSLGITQKELAARVGVSPTQISKWKSGEYMSSEMKDKLGNMVGFEMLEDPAIEADIIELVGGVEQARKWKKLSNYLARIAVVDGETGYYTHPLESPEEESFTLLTTLTLLKDMGVATPEEFPEELNFDYDSEDAESQTSSELLFTTHPISSLIFKIYEALVNVHGFFKAFLSDLVYDDSLNIREFDALSFECELFSLAAAKATENIEYNPEFNDFRLKILKQYESWLLKIKEVAYKNRIPLKTEIMSLVYDDHVELGVRAEEESLGFDDFRLHPDIYMNEILVNLRAIRQALPAICKKLDLDYEESVLDMSKFTLKGI